MSACYYLTRELNFRFAVDEYNDMHMDEPHLFISLKRVVGGEAILYEFSKEQITWNIKLTARNYSRRQLGPLAYYTATVFENMNNISGGQSLAYGSNLTFGGLSSSMWSNDLLIKD